MEYEGRIEELSEELNSMQGAMSEASLAVQGIIMVELEPIRDHPQNTTNL